MTDFCEFVLPDSSCQDLVAYVQDIVQSAKLLPTVRYGSDDHDATSAELTALWEPCTPPACAIAVWYNTISETYEVWSYISSTWRQTGSAGINSPYYTAFAGQGGSLGEGWVGDWIVDGNGRLYSIGPTLGPEELANASFDGWTGGNLDSWTVVGSDSEQNTIKVEGTASARLAGSPAAASAAQVVAINDGSFYVAHAWLREQTAYGASLNLNVFAGGGGTTTQSNVWERFRVSCIGSDLDTSANFTVGVAGSICIMYADDASLKEVLSGWNTVREFNGAYGTFHLDAYKTTGRDVGLVLNYQDADNYLLVLLAGNIVIFEVTAGAAVYLNQGSYTYVDGARLEVIRDSADDITVNYNGNSIITATALASPKTATQHGIVSLDDNDYFTYFGYTPE